MEIILFIKDLRQKGNLYYQTWMPLLLQYNGESRQSIKLSVNPSIPESTYHRIILYGIESFPKYIKSVTMVKQKSELILEIVNSKNSTELVDNEPVKKVQRQPQVKPKTNNDLIEQIVDYLNECTGKSYKPNSKVATLNINARLKEGYTLDDFRKVIFVKSTKWIGTKMEDYLTPNTLFGQKFESYLNENINTEQTKQEKAYEQVIKATELGFNS